MKDRPRLVVGISGASGVVYGIRLLELLRELPVETHLVMSKAAEMTIAYETDRKPAEVKRLATVCHPVGDIGASIQQRLLPDARHDHRALLGAHHVGDSRPA